MSRLIAENNLRQSDLGIFVREHGDRDIGYSDGAEAEAYLREVLSSANDLSSLSMELKSRASDWASEYHLSPLRANLLRALNLSGASRALELGCGCGALTRYLGEQGFSVDAVEGSRPRAELAKLRCRDLDNVNIITANFNALVLPDSTYDTVFLIGVTEYAARFSIRERGDENAVIALLSTVRDALAPGGVVVIAIENRVGLKYLLGAHEDHHAKRYIGVHEYRPDSSGMRTYDKRQWGRLLAASGLDHHEFLLPFPDYKLPTVVLSERYVLGNPYAYCHLDAIRSRDYIHPLEPDSPESLFWEGLCQAGTLADHANSFLVVATNDASRIAEVCDKDFAHLPEFQRPASLSCAISKKRGSAIVDRERMIGTEDAVVNLDGIIHRVAPETFHRGVLLSVEWARSLLIEEEAASFEDQLRNYYKFLADSGNRNELAIDLLPANIVVTESGDYAVFDQEWEVEWELEPDFIYFRALMWFALRYHQRRSLEVIQRNLQIDDVRSFVKHAFEVAGKSIADETLDRYLQVEQEFQSRIKGVRSDRILLDTPLVGARAVARPVARVYWRRGGEIYGETQSRVADIALDSERQTLCYELPSDANAMTHFRFDPCEARRPTDFGFLHLHGLRVFLCGDGGHECIWKLEGEEHIAAHARLSEISFHHASLGAVFAIHGADPYLEFEFIPRRLPVESEHYRVVVELTAPRSTDYVLVRDRYLVNEEIMSNRLRYLEERLSDYESTERELQTLKQSKAWRLAESYRSMIYHRIRPGIEFLLRGPRAVRSHGLAGTVRRLYSLYRPESDELERRRLASRTRYEIWKEEHRRMPPQVQRGPLISIVMPVYNVAPELLGRAIASVQNQTYVNWELCIADDASTQDDTLNFLRSLKGEKLKVKYLSRNLNIAGASNEALSLATGDYVTLLDNDDELAPGALAWVAECAVQTDADIIYSDEDFIRPDGHLDYPHFKPDYSPDLLLSHNYITHFLALKRTLCKRIGGFRSGYDGAQDYDLLLRAVEQAQRIEHISEPLYHWRMVKGSTSLDPDAKPEAHRNGKRALVDALRRRNIDGTILDANLPHFFRVRRAIAGRPLVSIVIPFKDKPGLLAQGLNSVLEKSTYNHFEVIGVSNNTVTPTTFDSMKEFERRDSRVRFVENNIPFSFSKLVNSGVDAARGEHVILFNNDIEILTPDWIEGFLEHSQRADVAVVGGKLYYPNNTIQHAGVGIGLGGYAGHFHKNFPAHATGYFNRLNVIQNVSAITAALLMVERRIYRELGGFDEENLVVAYNDVDFCLRARERGYLNVFTPYVEAYHHESISRGYEDTPEKQQRFSREQRYLREKYSDVIESGDPYYNPNFDQGRDDFSV